MSEQENIPQVKTLLEYDLQSFVFGIDKLRKEGWEFDPQMPPNVYGTIYEVGFVRAVSQEQIDKEHEELSKPTRADILRKAREAKAAKKEDKE